LEPERERNAEQQIRDGAQVERETCRDPDGDEKRAFEGTPGL
jgi:hypothetical protein